MRERTRHTVYEDAAQASKPHRTRAVSYPKSRRSPLHPAVAVSICLGLLAISLVWGLFTRYGPEVNVIQEQMTESLTLPDTTAVNLSAAYLPDYTDPDDPEVLAAASAADRTADKIVALTFDDGPQRTNTSRILDALKNNGAAATFFCVGDRIDLCLDVVQRAADEGHEIANHTWSHRDLSDLSLDDAKKEINEADALISSITGKQIVLVRPPKGKCDTDLAKKLDAQMVLWTVDPKDWKVRDARSITKAVLNEVQDGSIILLHDLYADTAQAVESLLPELKDQGYAFVTVSELLEIKKQQGQTVDIIYPKH